MSASIPAEDTRAKRLEIRGTPEELARVHAHAATRGYSGPVWARNVIRDALEAQSGYRDAARRAVTRRPNRNPRKDKQKVRGSLAMQVSAAEHEHITGLAASQGQTITEWAWGVLAAALEQPGHLARNVRPAQYKDRTDGN